VVTDVSSYLYGTLTRRRLNTSEQADLVFSELEQAGPQAAPAGPPPDPVRDKVRHWLDALAALVPAEVLALHAVAMSYGTETQGSGDNAVTRITEPAAMMVVYAGLLVLAAGLYVLGVWPIKGKLNLARAAIPVAAFVVWTMLQPSTAFDAFPFGLSTFVRVMIAAFSAIALTALVNFLATKADKSS
jgi:hypothetical protein